MELFKYCRSEHLRSMHQSGSVRVGTLFDYRNTEQHGSLVADPTEGTKKLGGPVPDLTPENIEYFPGLQGFISLGPGSKLTNLIFQDNVVCSPNLLIFSASATYERTAHEKWLSEEGYDSCYRILSARLFFRALTYALGSSYRFMGFDQVTYSKNFHLQDPRSGLHPAFVKRCPDHADQAEIRAVWSPVDDCEVKPIVLTNSRANIYICTHAELGASNARA